MNHGTLDQDTARGLQLLRERIAAAHIPPTKLDETITIATWNVRELGRRPRREASLHYIAEIIGQFDLVTLIELRDNVNDLSKVLQYLGPYWSVVFSDYVQDHGGNRERIAFVFDRRSVVFTGLASQAQAPRRKQGDEYLPEINWWRPPYIASFRAGSFDFILIAAHVRWSDSEKARITELTMLADWVYQRSIEQYVGDKDILVLGDLNVESIGSPSFKAITSRNLRMPAALAGVKGTDLKEGKRYDQILHMPAYTKSFTDLGGALDFYCGDHASLYPGEALTKTDFTYELSDHLPLWMQVNTDIEGEKLDQILNPKSIAA